MNLCSVRLDSLLHRRASCSLHFHLFFDTQAIPCKLQLLLLSRFFRLLSWKMFLLFLAPSNNFLGLLFAHTLVSRFCSLGSRVSLSIHSLVSARFSFIGMPSSLLLHIDSSMMISLLHLPSFFKTTQTQSLMTVNSRSQLKERLENRCLKYSSSLPLASQSICVCESLSISSCYFASSGGKGIKEKLSRNHLEVTDKTFIVTETP